MSDFTARIANLEDASLSPASIRKLHLMEASAGTGKTFSIQTIYLRLILIEGLTVQQVLTVTFTKDATKELQDRLQKILRDALDYLEGSKPHVEDRTRLIVDLAVSAGDIGPAKTRERLRLALLDFDMAAIYTIHGFCQRVLKRFAFETRQGFDVEPANNADEQIEQLCKDWWRTNIYSMHADMAGVLAACGKFALTTVTELAQKLISKPDAILDGYQGNTGASASLESIMQQKLQAARNALGKPFIANDLPDPMHAALESLQPNVLLCREAIDKQNWGEALKQLQALAAIRTDVENPCIPLAEGLKSVCREIKAIIKGKTKGFAFRSDRSLTHTDKDALLPAHTREVAECVTTFIQTKASIDKALFPNPCIKGKPTKAFEALAALHDHFQRKTELSADDLAGTIKTVADGNLGLADTICIAAESIIPSFSDLMESFTRAPVLDAAVAIRKQYQETRAAARTASFNDYLVNLRKALQESEALVEILRNEFRAALIDEFQDTDPIQWGIFQSLFQDAAIPCFLVGDPKQAIYRFRNGDVETYFSATQSVSAKYPLSINYRSEKRLIDAVNQIFMDSPDNPTFGDQITYLPSQAPCNSAAQKPTLCIKGQPDTHPFKILLIEKQNKPQNMKRAAELTAQEIARLLLDTDTVIQKESADGSVIHTPLEPKDIAVLVRRHDEGHAIAQALKARNIPSVRQGTGDVWQTDEGHNLWVMLETILDPRNPNKVRTALISAWGGISTTQIQQLNNGHPITPPYGDQDSVTMEHFVAMFVEYNEIWQQRGYPAMFRQLTRSLALKQRLLAQPDNQGQRRLANITHLSELVERKIIEERKTPEALLAWMRRQFAQATADKDDDATLRLETDDNAVKIMTIFTSKGLQFPIVFAPALFMMDVSQRGNTYEYHDEAGNLLIIQKREGDPRKDFHKQSEKREIEQELIRQMYVALTRAIHRTVVIALNSGARDGRPRKGEQQRFKPIGVLGELLRLPLKTENERAIVDINQAKARFEMVGASPCAIAIHVADDAQEPLIMPQSAPDTMLGTPPVRPHIDSTMGHGSFSSIAPHATTTFRPNPVLIESEVKDADGGTALMEEPAIPGKPTGIFAFPSGAQTGTCWHELFEDLDFATSNDAVIQSLVEHKLGTYGFLKNVALKEERIKVTIEMVKNVLRTPLPKPICTEGTPPFSFAQIASCNRKTEWSFNFPARPNQNTHHLRAAIGLHAQYEPFVRELETWDQMIPGGYLTGFVDLLFRHNGRYFIADWKSNRRNGTQADFTLDGLYEEMSAHRYWLQYLIYTVAIHQYLTNALPGYSYHDHFGGIYYVFLRGVDGRQLNGYTNGIFYDLPPLDLINDLSAILGDFA